MMSYSGFYTILSKSIVLSWLCMVALLASAEDVKPKILWMQVDWAPSWIMEGPMQGQGYGDQIEAALFDALPGYRHQPITTTFSRLVDWLATQDNACTSTGFYRWPNENGMPREDIVWSAPVLMFEWHGMVVHQSQLNQFPAARPLSFASFIQSSDQILLLQDGRNLGPVLNELIKPFEEKGKVLRRSGGYNSTFSLYRMLAQGRADYTIDYPFMVRYANSLDPQLNMHFIPLQEHVREYGFGAVVCSKSAVTTPLINDINANIEDLRQGPLRAINKQWFEPSDAREQFWLDWQERLLPLKQ
ncbi:hypothetical protein [Lacimicrobium sp. SS2-24]|uniref:hypothetical protein n=1 Tax=Lacimicrobium sp. SS2-24 TaxID=2005569 RepID=UPI000B4BC9E8|nr:hypothetical protein [Lacimicrobium sp. SS2-24]